jgi:hypothetical protein
MDTGGKSRTGGAENVQEKQQGTKLLLIGKWLVPESNVRVWKNSPDSHLWMAGALTRNRAMHKYFTGTPEIRTRYKINLPAAEQY